MFAQLRPSYSAGLAQFRASYAAAAAGATTVVTEMDAGNVDPALVSITGADTASPTIWLDRRADAGDWRHFLFAVEGVEGKAPTFQFNRATKHDSDTPAADYCPVWTQDFVTWTSAPSRTLVGGTTGYIQWQFTDPLPAGRVYVASHPIGRQADAVALANNLLTNYVGIASPAPCADANGVFATSVVENDASGRPIGGHPMYAIKLAWPGPTTDGGPKRKLVQFAGIHAAGEAQSWLVFRGFLDWIMLDQSQAAQDFRANWDVYTYFNLTPNGVYGGHWRYPSQNRLTDPNRDWDNTSSLAEIAATRSAVNIDHDAFDAFLSWHAHPSTTSIWIPGKNVQNDAAPDAAHTAFINTGNTIFGVTAKEYGSSTYNTDAWWAQNWYGTTVAFHAETGTLAGGTVAKYNSIGQNWAKTLQAVDAQGVFYTPSGTEHILTVASSTQAQTSGAVTVSSGATTTHTLTVTPSTQSQTSSAVVVDHSLPQHGRPTSDVSGGSWTATSGSLASCVGEVNPSDSDYISASGTSPCTLALNAVATPGAGMTQAVKFRAWSPTAGSVTVELLQNTTVIASWSQALTTSATTYTKTLTSGQSASVTDWAALRIRLTAA